MLKLYLKQQRQRDNQNFNWKCNSTDDQIFNQNRGQQYSKLMSIYNHTLLIQNKRKLIQISKCMIFLIYLLHQKKSTLIFIFISISGLHQQTILKIFYFYYRFHIIFMLTQNESSTHKIFFQFLKIKAFINRFIMKRDYFIFLNQISTISNLDQLCLSAQRKCVDSRQILMIYRKRLFGYTKIINFFIYYLFVIYLLLLSFVNLKTIFIQLVFNLEK
ncbi:transmembrane protein, putative (macronuclear) [Tetrahymena thermophila SB210]|uniref:Transmembrane protein, putative n=1 Tax=Tetrahymena thermophila (strain SB210) TaxID=312017 RepID=W7XIA0_TETTS|nr:transmembrane protein, putative [Tetrahymena thermophila SB210]EWS74451.1 transmembrane protein, putative [Tetrahymena thermophila SB210]|eukprot:XP_012653028.1 transmembrane protein, putative [Tetrahymena thermophila SB210]